MSGSQVTPEVLLRALTTRSIAVAGMDIEKMLDAEKATESRDALSKGLYAKLFDWLVAAINRKIPSYGESAQIVVDSTPARCI